MLAARVRAFVAVFAGLLVSSCGCRKLPSRVVQKAYLSDHANVSKTGSPGTAAGVAVVGYKQGQVKLTLAMRGLMADYARTTSGGAPAHGPASPPRDMTGDFDAVQRAFARAKASTPPSHADLSTLADEALSTARVVYADYGDAVRNHASAKAREVEDRVGRETDARLRADLANYESAVGRLQARLDAIAREQPVR